MSTRLVNTIIRAAMLVVLIPITFANAADKPRLILQITVDQLRGDLPTRYYDRLGEGGFRYLWESGIVYRNAHHAHANTETIVGHATLATGAHPSAHGMIGNLWFDRETGFTTYNVEDPNYSLLTKGASVDASTEIDPTQRAARSEGRSPAAILVTTFSDELRSNTGGKAKVIGVSVKDRGAISMAGHTGTWRKSRLRDPHARKILGRPRPAGSMLAAVRARRLRSTNAAAPMHGSISETSSILKTSGQLFMMSCGIG